MLLSTWKQLCTERNYITHLVIYGSLTLVSPNDYIFCIVTLYPLSRNAWQLVQKCSSQSFHHYNISYVWTQILFLLFLYLNIKRIKVVIPFFFQFLNFVGSHTCEDNLIFIYINTKLERISPCFIVCSISVLIVISLEEFFLRNMSIINVFPIVFLNLMLHLLLQHFFSSLFL